MTISTVVVGVDGSDCSQRALEAAIDVMAAVGTVHVVLAYDAPSTKRINEAYAAVPDEFRSSVDLLAEERKALDAAAKFVTDNGLTAVDHLVDDDPASAIIAVAEGASADLIVVGSRGLGRASQIVRGSVSTKIAHHSPINFLVVH